MIAYIFPGQGSQFPGMGKDLAHESAIAQEVLRVVNEVLGFSLTDIMFGDDAATLALTEIQQAAVFAHSVAAFAALRKRHDGGPAVVAGHSLGEYSALVAAGCMELAEAAELVRLRGEIMATVGNEVHGAMGAVIGMDADAVRALVQDASSEGTLVVANYNCPGQIVISGEGAAVTRAQSLARQRGARAIPLKVSGAFHSPLMAAAADQFRPHIEGASMRDADVPLVSNVDASPRSAPGDIKAALVAQVTGSVHWEQSIRRMIADGVNTFVEIGPGDVLSKMIRRIDSTVAVFAVGNMSDIPAFLEAGG